MILGMLFGFLNYIGVVFRSGDRRENVCVFECKVGRLRVRFY